MHDRRVDHLNKEDLYLHIINNLCDGVYFVDTERRITFWNKAAEDITGYKAEEIVGRQCQDNILNHIDENGTPLCIAGCPLFATIVDGKQRKHDVFLRHKEGHRIPILVNIFPLEENGEIIGAIEVFTPNSPIVYDDTLVEKLSNMAMKDELTNLPNRRYTETFIEYKLNEFRKFNNLFAVLFLDIDNFGEFNNTYGHDLGDTVLKNASESIKRTMRKTDLFGRWGGEEFIGVYPIKIAEDTKIIAEKTRILIENTEVDRDDEHLRVTASIGATVVREGDTIESIVERADKLMYQSKQKGKNCVTID